VSVKTGTEIAGDRRHEGILLESDDDGLVVDVAGESRRIEFGQVKSARTIYRWEQAPKPGKKAARS